MVFSGHSLAVSRCLMAVMCQEADFLSVQDQDRQSLTLTLYADYADYTLTIL